MNNFETKCIGYNYSSRNGEEIRQEVEKGWCVFAVVDMYTPDKKTFFGGTSGAQFYVTYIRAYTR